MIKKHNIEVNSPLFDGKVNRMMKRIARGYDTQDVNQQLVGDDYAAIINVMKDVFTEKQIKKLAEICPINLNQNVEMHNDKRFLSIMKYSPTVYFLVLDSITTRNNQDSPNYNYLICGADHSSLETYGLYSFNANKYHGVMTDKKLLGFTFFFKR